MQQRTSIARAIITRPKFIVLDEPTASLDLSVRAKLLDTLDDLDDVQETYVNVDITEDMLQED